MATFGINASSEQVLAFKEMIKTCAAPEDANQAQTLERMCRVAVESMSTATLSEGGVDAKTLDMALGTIRALFGASLAAKKQLESGYAAKMDELNRDWLRKNGALQEQLREKAEELKDNEYELSVLRDEADKAKAEYETRLQAQKRQIDQLTVIADAKTELEQAKVELAVSRATVVLQARLEVLSGLLTANGIAVPD